MITLMVLDRIADAVEENLKAVIRVFPEGLGPPESALKALQAARRPDMKYTVVSCKEAPAYVLSRAICEAIDDLYDELDKQKQKGLT